MTDAERIRHAAKLIKLFEHSRNPKDRHRIVIVDEISRVHLGQTEPLVTLKTAFRCLACGALTVRAQCPRPDCTYCRYPPWQSCGLRFFCDSCAGNQKDRQVKQWLWLIMGVLKGSNLGPVSGTRLEWMLPDVRDAGNILRFGDHIRHTFADRLYEQSITPCQWMLATAIDPMRGTIRGLYLGPPDTRLVTGGFKTGNCNNSGIWVPKVGTVALPHPHHPAFQTDLLSALQWTVNSHPQRSCAEPSDLAPSRAIELYRAYRGRHLYSVHGLLYRAKSRQAKEQRGSGTGEGGYDGYGAPIWPEYCPTHQVRLRNVLDFHLPAGDYAEHKCPSENRNAHR